MKLEDVPAPGPTRDYECSGEKLASRLGLAPTRSVADAVQDLLARLAPRDRAALRDPRYYNLRWLVDGLPAGPS